MKYIVFSISLLTSYMYGMELTNKVSVDSKEIKKQDVAQSKEELVFIPVSELSLTVEQYKKAITSTCKEKFLKKNKQPDSKEIEKRNTDKVSSSEQEGQIYDLSLFVLEKKRLQKNKLHNGYAIYGCMNLPEQNITTKKESGMTHVSLHCSFKHLDYINTDPDFQFLHEPKLASLLTLIDFSYNKIQTLHLDTLLEQCPNLISLNVKNNKIRQINYPNKWILSKLAYFDISQNRIESEHSISPLFHTCDMLTYLNIKNNRLPVKNKQYLLSHVAGYFSVRYKCSENTIEGDTCKIVYEPKPDNNEINKRSKVTLLLSYDEKIVG
ncbi:MAG TPA: hypothetical protein VGW78_03845 [Candidatus Babeliales bacterium]|nr:hypothetical protein [Candidatus Babeliales bacterium]